MYIEIRHWRLWSCMKLWATKKPELKNSYFILPHYDCYEPVQFRVLKWKTFTILSQLVRKSLLCSFYKAFPSINNSLSLLHKCMTICQLKLFWESLKTPSVCHSLHCSTSHLVSQLVDCHNMICLWGIKLLWESSISSFPSRNFSPRSNLVKSLSHQLSLVKCTHTQ